MRIARRNLFLSATLVVLVITQFALNESVPEERSIGALFPDLATRDAARIVLAQGDTEIELVRQGEDWFVPAQLGFLARTRAVQDLLLTLTSLTNSDLLSEEAEMHGLYGVGQDGLRARVFDGAGAVIADLVQGGLADSARGSGAATFVRSLLEENTNAVFRAPHCPPVTLDVMQWLQTRWLRLTPPTVTRIVIDGQDLPEAVRGRSIEKDDEGAWNAGFAGEVPKRAVLDLLGVCTNLFLSSVHAAGPLPGEAALEVSFYEGDVLMDTLRFGAELPGGRSAGRSTGDFVALLPADVYALVREAVRVLER
jgi:hypothetical protein